MALSPLSSTQKKRGRPRKEKLPIEIIGKPKPHLPDPSPFEKPEEQEEEKPEDHKDEDDNEDDDEEQTAEQT